MSIFISIIIPVYNAEKYLPETLRNLPPHDDWELILVNDGSTDSSLELCQKYAEQHCNVTVISQPNGGPGKARNTGIQHAVGNYITFLDADDGIQPGSLEAACEYLQQNPVDLLFQQMERRTLAGESYFPVKYSGTEILDREKLMLLWCKNDSRIKGYLWGKIYRKTLLKGIKIPENMRFAEDMFVLSDIFPKVQTACFFADGAYIYHEHTKTPTTEDWNISKSRQLVKAYLHRWECAIQEQLPVSAQINAWYNALTLLFGERNIFPEENWNAEWNQLKTARYTLFPCLGAIKGIKRKLGLLRNLCLLQSAKNHEPENKKSPPRNS